MRTYVAENAVMLGEEWDRRHARYYVDLIKRYQVLPLERWPEIDVEWGNMYKGWTGAPSVLSGCGRPRRRIWWRIRHRPLRPGTAGKGARIGRFRLARYALALAHYVSGGIRPAACAGLP